MKMTPFFLSTTRYLTLVGALAGLSLPASAAAMFTLKGETPHVKQSSDSEVRLSVLGWTEPEAAQAIVEEYRKYTESRAHDSFAAFLQEQQTRGYLFTKAATGYSVKYAWQDEASADSRAVLLVTPALKTRNPYLWQERNEDPAPFSLIEVHWEGQQAILKTSLDGDIEIDAAGHLQLRDPADVDTFATLVDDTPYYLKKTS